PASTVASPSSAHGAASAHWRPSAPTSARPRPARGHAATPRHGTACPGGHAGSSPGAPTVALPTSSRPTTRPRHGDGTRLDYRPASSTSTSSALPATSSEAPLDLGGRGQPTPPGPSAVRQSLGHTP